MPKSLQNTVSTLWTTFDTECILSYHHFPLDMGRSCGNRPPSSLGLESNMKTERWFLYEYKNGELVVLSKPFKTKALAEKARQKYSEQEQKKIGLGRSF